ncbi:phytanoyl-CoA dioxygenase family protein [Hymenobacter sp. ASUV-10]|uniref:Phytanoyl-CoA dioxygenase family protein n=1 Tax=Hymenobacter aranciens TaxID=3063996 RepID=A0ABT9BAB1_9BACT|nr:phytanoyl-CoA dioxygenase family protein [Hymenobacter sp. ASUV-10]MDO7875205.1 phytanoyl-CoA dioxygenase family protein [Hymenobacter sp. ASUV-10]
MKARLNQQEVDYRIEGTSSPGEAGVQLAADTDLTAGNAWATAGYVVAPWLTKNENELLRNGLAELVRAALRNTGLEIAADWDVTNYHRVVGTDAARHLAVVNQTKEFPLTALPLPVTVLEARVSELCGRKVRVHNPANGQQAFHLRIVRPQITDNNPPHRDTWLDRLRHGLNIYFPVAGSTADSSLPLVPGSHWWPESQTSRTQAGAVYNGNQYSVPALASATTPLEFIRPNPGPDEVLLFSPYLLHGGAVNLNPDQTRISLEMRFWAV